MLKIEEMDIMATQVETINTHEYVKRPYFIVFLTLGLLTILAAESTDRSISLIFGLEK